MPAVSTARSIDSVFAMGSESTMINHGTSEQFFTSLHAAQVYINAQIKAITDDGTYADYSRLFDPILSESLAKQPVEEKLALMRESVRDLSMGVVK
jgi:hypothetical protein